MARPTVTIRLAALGLSLIAVLRPAPAAAQTQLFEVERSDATKLLQVQDDAGLVVKGTFDVGTIPAAGGGVRLMWYPKKAAFRAGRVNGVEWDDGSIGQWSVAFGENTTASGPHSVAMNGGTVASGDRSVAIGSSTTASGDFSTAMGHNTKASGNSSTAIGSNTTASGNGSTAMGNQTTAGGLISTAMGQATIASGDFSTAMGHQTLASGITSTAIGSGTVAAGLASVAMGTLVTAQGAGSFIFGDRSTNNVITAGENQFLVRAHGGIGFNSGVSIGCDLPAGTGAWACTSSRLAKEGFEDVDGETVLAKLASIRIQSWRYLGTPAVHVGPTAEDFRAAFGLGEGSTKIATVDADGIALRSVQALEARTTALRAENTELRADLAALRAELMALRDGLHASTDAQQ